MKVFTKKDYQGKTQFNSSIAEQIVTCTLETIPGIVPLHENKKVSKRYMQGVRIETINGSLYVNVYVFLQMGYSGKDVAYEVQQKVKMALESTASFKVKEIDVHIVDVFFPAAETSEQN